MSVCLDHFENGLSSGWGEISPCMTFLSHSQDETEG